MTWVPIFTYLLLTSKHVKIKAETFDNLFLMLRQLLSLKYVRGQLCVCLFLLGSFLEEHYERLLSIQSNRSQQQSSWDKS